MRVHQCVCIGGHNSQLITVEKTRTRVRVLVKGDFMSSYHPAILVNGVSADNFVAVENVIERDFERVLDALYEWQRFSDVVYDDTHDTPTFEAVRLPSEWWSHNEKRFESKTKRNARFISKRKEVK